ncbi:hypothetical protein ACEN2I_08090 [Flavobacterium sp. W22_SRS_FK3]|uniref:hypothetical protein n=1 Tax=Flavobacterium sp. W22_SRS_FK3 TaxID=3240275 RepID=UPI003F933B28
MKYYSLVVLWFLLANTSIQAQERKFTYIQFGATISITGNPYRNKPDNYEGEKKAFFIPNAIGSKLGYGVHYKQWLTLGIHSGLDWKWDDKLVAVPVYLNFGLSPKISESGRITLQLGYGKGFALGRGNLSGEYKKIRLGITGNDHTIFVEVSDYAFQLYDQGSIGSISLGISLIRF